MRLARVGDFGPNESRPDYGKLQSGQRRTIKNVGKTKQGRERTRRETCGRTVTETIGTIFSHPRTPEEEIPETLVFIAEWPRVYSSANGKVSKYAGMGRPPNRKWSEESRHYLQGIKQREQGRVVGTRLCVGYGEIENVLSLLGPNTAYVGPTHRTSRHFNGRLARKVPACSKALEMPKRVRPLKGLRLEVADDPQRRGSPRTPAMAAGLTDHVWTVKEVLTAVSFSVGNT